MPSSASAVTPLPPQSKPSNPDHDDGGGDDIEYEEIEVEEEVEVEEEFEEEDSDEEIGEDDEHGGGEDNEPQIGEEDKEPQFRNEFGGEEEGEGDNEPLIGEDLTPVREEIRENDTDRVLDPEEHEEPIKPDLMGLGTSVSDLQADVPAVQETVGDIKVSDPTEKESALVKGERNSKDNNTQSPAGENGEVSYVIIKPFVGDVDVPLATYDASRERDNDILSVVAESNPAAIEVEDMQISPDQISPRLCAPQIRLRDSSSSAEFDVERKRQKVVCEFYGKGWCIRGNSCRFLHVKEGQDAAVKKAEVMTEASSSAYISPQFAGENSKLKNSETEKVVICKDEELKSGFLPPDRVSIGKDLYLDNNSSYGAPLVKGNSIDRNRTYHGNFSGCSVVPDYHHLNTTRVSSFSTAKDENINVESDIVRRDHRSRDLSHLHSRQHLSVGFSPWNANALGTHAHLGRNLEHRASLFSSTQQKSSPFSHSELESLPRNSILRNTEAAKYKTNISSNDWEPSIPFHPSHDITRNLLLKEGLYDPIRDSMEQREVEETQVKSSCSGQESSMMNLHMQSNLKEEDRLLNSVHVGDTEKHDILSSSGDNKLNLDQTKQKMELSVNVSRNNDETDTNSKQDGHVQYEEKALKYFQAALIEFVKELVKPTWKEGLMSKDAHKLIVKKAVDKVLSSFEPHQIPSSPESIKFYLSSSQPKLAKLVEGYIEKYGKF